jgi:hypothetical protein
MKNLLGLRTLWIVAGAILCFVISEGQAMLVPQDPGSQSNQDVQGADPWKDALQGVREHEGKVLQLLAQRIEDSEATVQDRRAAVAAMASLGSRASTLYLIDNRNLSISQGVQKTDEDQAMAFPCAQAVVKMGLNAVPSLLERSRTHSTAKEALGVASLWVRTCGKDLSTALLTKASSEPGTSAIEQAALARVMDRIEPKRKP